MNTSSKLLCGLLMCMSVAAQAAVITVSGHSFDDLGGSTVDLTSNLEWRDISPTLNRSTCSVIKDVGGAIPGGCSSFDNLDLIPNTDGWRVATRSEVDQLLTDWFGTTFTTNTTVNAGAQLATQFINTFSGSTGGNVLRPNYDYTSGTSIQATGYGVWATGSVMEGVANGSINSVNTLQAGGFGTVLVRDTNVPEPGSLALLALAVPALALARRRRG